jgi:uncharacterized lipoprotein
MRLLTLLVACAGLSACAFIPDSIDVPYESMGTASVVSAAKGAKVSVKGVDTRTTDRDRVSVKKNGYGMEMANISATNNIPYTVAKAVESELSSRGFAMSQDGCRLDVELVRFYSDFKIGFFAGDAIADAAANVKLTGPDGKILYTKYYQAGGAEADVLLAVGSNARAALIVAMRSLVSAIVNDKNLQNAIIAAQPASGGGKPSS